MIITIPGDLDIRADELRNVFTGAVEGRRLMIGALDLLAYMDAPPTQAQWQAFPKASVVMYTDRRMPSYALEIEVRLTEDEAKSIVAVIEQVEARVKAELEKDIPL